MQCCPFSLGRRGVDGLRNALGLVSPHLLINFSTHVKLQDEQSDAQRQLAASLILHRAHYEALRTKSPVILLGDFNSPAFGRDCAGYEIITGIRPPVGISQEFKERFPVTESASSFNMIDFMGEAPRSNVSGNYGTRLVSNARPQT